MTHPASTGAGLVRMGDSDFVPQNPEDDLRGKDVYDPEGQRIGGVKDLYIDHREREMRFLQVSTGSFLGMGEKPLLVPVEAVVEVAQHWLTIEPGRTRKGGQHPSSPGSRLPARGPRLAHLRRSRGKTRPAARRGPILASVRLLAALAGDGRRAN